MQERSNLHYEPHEDMKILAMLDHGVGYRRVAKQLAAELKRTECGLASRAMHLKRTRRLVCARKIEPAPPTLIRQIVKAHLADWYVLGWRVLDFSPLGTCRIAWPGSREPRWPGGLS